MHDVPSHLRLTEDFEREWLAVDEAEQESALHDAYLIARSNNSIDLAPELLLCVLRWAMAEIERVGDLHAAQG